MRSLLILALVSLALASCSRVPKMMIGEFEAKNGDAIEIKKDGSIYWSPLAKTRDKFVFVGMAAPEREDVLVVPLVVPSSSAFLGSKFTFSGDYTHVRVDWGGLNQDAGKNRAIEYARKE